MKESNKVHMLRTEFHNLTTKIAPCLFHMRIYTKNNVCSMHIDEQKTQWQSNSI